MKVQIIGKCSAIFLLMDPFCSFTANTTQWYISISASFSSSAYYLYDYISESFSTAAQHS